MTESETPQPNAETPETEKPADTLGKVKGFVEEHPVAMVAGGILVGALVAGALSRAGSGVTGDKATRKGTLSRMSLPRRAADLAAVGLEIAAAYVAGAAGEKAAAATSEAPEDAAKPARPSLPALADKTLRTLAPVITRHLPGKKAD
ncbi:hypothetical protein NSE01_06040 [Novosphingobium sediminis]|uniref:Uncharacterized protein n=1 Tax=Novosphingobium sediminis TaxID=707214 RepID=A0A512AGD9_9SPHN|nr:hypothetical protein [Novosphingobium sediminis]GEN98771.1 hypothetical protein NSE01_06040 [Novosphingobium sediminis]